MLDPDLVLAALLSAVKSVPQLVDALGGPTATDGSPTIYSHQYLAGIDNSLTRAIEDQPAGTIMIAYSDLLEGNFGGEGRWKHRLTIFIRPMNAAPGGAVPPSSPLHLGWLLLNTPVTGSEPRNLRQISLFGDTDGRLVPMDTPTIKAQTDSQQQDLFYISVSIPEQGDS